MAAYYSIIQYVPDPVADERINAGILVFDERRVHAQFVRGWGRLQRFGNKDIGFLKSFAEELVERCKATLFTDGQITPTMIEQAAATWQGSIQLTEPRGSLLDLKSLLRDTEVRFLAGDRPVQARPLTKNSLRSFALKAAKLAFALRGGVAARQYVRPKYDIQGGVDSHEFSLAIANGHPYVAAEVFSFVGVDQRAQARDVQASAWAFEDVRKQYRDLRLAALVVRDERPTATYRKAVDIFAKIGVEVVPQESVPQWAGGFADLIFAEGSRGSG